MREQAPLTPTRFRRGMAPTGYALPFPTLGASLGLLTSVVLTAAMTVGPVLAQADIPRRPDGRPDLSGTYDTATLTPLVRPAELGDRLTLTEEEAQAIADHWRGNLDKDLQPSDPERDLPPEGGIGIYAPEFTGAAGKVGGYNAFFVDIGESSFQLDGKYRTSIITDPPNGQLPGLSDEGKRRAERAALYRHENTGTAWWLDRDFGPYDDPELRPLAERCLMARSAAGPPSLPGMYNNIKRIVQTDDTVVILVEWMHDARVIRLRSEHESPSLPKWLGDSIGHWDGDTLVVETTHFLESVADTRTSRDLRVIERFSPIEGGDLRYQFTVEDPRYEKPWSGEYPWPATEDRMYEYACHEGNYSMKGILAGARLLEREGLKEKGAESSTDLHD